MGNESNIVGGEEEIILEPEMFGGAPGTTDFNELENRPSYAGEVMTGETNIPAVPTAVSQLTNDSGYQTASEVSDAVGIEATDRQNADNGLQGQIDALAAASDVTDIVGTKAELNAYDTSKLKDNDIIKVLQDESEDDETTYYRWSTTTQTFTLIGAEGPYYTKSATDQLLQAKQDKLTAGANITIDENNEISATDTTYTAGTNVQISEQNVISATDTTYSDFTGTDGADAGTSGLVPAPATTDAGKYLKADGTWDSVPTPTVVQTEGSSTTDVMSQAAVTAMKGKARVLTSADYNYPTTAPTKIALWLLPTGIYEIGSGVIVAMNASTNDSTGGLYIVSNTSGYGVQVIRMRRNTRSGVTYWVTTQGGADVIKNEVLRPEIVNNLTTSTIGSVLDAAQGRILKDTIDGLITKNAGAPTTSTVGTVGKLIEDTTNGKLYICTDTTGGSYTWIEVGAGAGGGIHTLTADDYNYPTDSPDGVAIWLLDKGMYAGATNVKVYYDATPISMASSEGYTWIINETTGAAKNYIQMKNSNDLTSSAYLGTINPTTGINRTQRSILTTDSLENSLTSTSTSKALTAAQGRNLNIRITDLAVGTTETYSIATTDWTALSSSSPYDYSATVTSTYTIGANTIAELLNDSPVDFANHGFAIGSITGQSVTIYSIGQPSASVSLKVNYKG